MDVKSAWAAAHRLPVGLSLTKVLKQQAAQLMYGSCVMKIMLLFCSGGIWQIKYQFNCTKDN